MLALGFRFRAGRYHATPWGRHVNEGEVAWPPSSWTLARALIAVWHRKLAPGSFPEEDLEALLAALASEPPVYDLPRAVHAHSRHYMPIRKGRSAGTTLVIDAFARLGVEAELVMAWRRLELPQRLVPLLDALLDRLGYLGRAESWVEARRIDDWDGTANCEPVGTDRAEGGPDAAEDQDARELVELLVPRSPGDYETFRKHLLEGLGARDLKPAERRKIEGTLPRDWLQALEIETADLQRAGWSRPPAARVQGYLRPERALQPRAEVVAAPVPDPEQLPTTARFAVYGRPLPRLEDAVKIGECLRKALLNQASRTQDGEPAPPVFTGRRPAGDNDHGHAFYLSEDFGGLDASRPGDGLIDHVIVHADQGFEPAAEEALAALERLWMGSDGEWQLVLETLDTREAVARATPLLAGSSEWISVTPYLHPWFQKNRFREADQIRKECRLRDLPPLLEVKSEELVLVGGRERRPVHFHRFRSKRGLTQPDTRGSFWRLRFEEPVDGPLALGFGCHFGLGLFRPVSTPAPPNPTDSP
ncbi:MAG: type I-U CRISPR-associated protein Csb2 [Acidobacteriota bacterium]